MGSGTHFEKPACGDTRRRLFWICVVLALLAVPLRWARAAGDSPNVLLVTIDTLRVDHLACYGYANIHTPNMDQLSAAGARFANAYSAIPITLPSHTVILTGTYPMHTGMHDFGGNKLNPSQATLATLLHAQGYATGAVVGSAVLDSRFGLNRGFDFYYSNFDFNRLSESNLDDMERPGNEVVDRGLAWLAKNGQKKFFLWLHMYDPHFPYHPPAPFSTEYKTHPYDGEIAFDDAQLGRVVRYLKEKNLYDRTLIVLAADHGEGLGEHGEKTHGFFIYNSTLHVPLIIKLPASRAAAPRVVKSSVGLVDIAPTILSVTGTGVPKEMQGRNLLPLMGGAEDKTPTELYAETYLPRIHFDWSELRGNLVGNYKFIEAPKPELYDLAADPRESHNLFYDKKLVADGMQKRLSQMIEKDTAKSPGQSAQSSPVDPILAEKLKSLGYVAFDSGASGILTDRKSPDPKDRIQVYELVSEAMADSQHGRYSSSIPKLEAALKIEKDSIPVHYLLGLDYYRQQDFPRSIEQFDAVLKRSPDYALAIYFAGLAYGRAGHWANSAVKLKRALELDPTNFSAAFNLGAAELKLGNVDEAAAAFNQSVQIYSDYAPGYEALGEIYLFQGRVDEAIEALRKAVEISPDSTAFHQSLAKALDAKGLHDQAEQERQKGKPLNP
ncbi:MAG: sulfatase-like hydrolase/transferase [Candidatus Acidiferrales bacterium]